LVRNYTGLYYDHDGTFRAQVRLSDGAEVAVSSEVFSPGQWHHLAMVVDDVNQSLSLYVDGEEVSGSPAEYSGTLGDHDQTPFYIGTSEPLTEMYEYRFSGDIDEAQIYDRTVSSLEVQMVSTCPPGCRIFLPVIMKPSQFSNSQGNSEKIARTSG
jgi:hypothetical protein